MHRSEESGRQVHASERRRFPAKIGTIGAWMLQSEYSKAPAVYCGGVRVELDQAEDMARLMEDLGRDDIAAAVRELAELVCEQERLAETRA